MQLVVEAGNTEADLSSEGASLSGRGGARKLRRKYTGSVVDHNSKIKCANQRKIKDTSSFYGVWTMFDIALHNDRIFCGNSTMYNPCVSNQ